MQPIQDTAEKVLSHIAFEITKPFYFPNFFFLENANLRTNIVSPPPCVSIKSKVSVYSDGGC